MKYIPFLFVLAFCVASCEKQGYGTTALDKPVDNNIIELFETHLTDTISIDSVFTSSIPDTLKLLVIYKINGFIRSVFENSYISGKKDTMYCYESIDGEKYKCFPTIMDSAFIKLVKTDTATYYFIRNFSLTYRPNQNAIYLFKNDKMRQYNVVSKQFLTNSNYDTSGIFTGSSLFMDDNIFCLSGNRIGKYALSTDSYDSLTVIGTTTNIITAAGYSDGFVVASRTGTAVDFKKFNIYTSVVEPLFEEDSIKTIKNWTSFSRPPRFCPSATSGILYMLHDTLITFPDVNAIQSGYVLKTVDLNQNIITPLCYFNPRNVTKLLFDDISNNVYAIEETGLIIKFWKYDPGLNIWSLLLEASSIKKSSAVKLLSVIAPQEKSIFLAFTDGTFYQFDYSSTLLNRLPDIP